MSELSMKNNEILNEFVGIVDLSPDSHCGQILEEVIIDCKPLIIEFLKEPINTSVTAENFNYRVTADRKEKLSMVAVRLLMALNQGILTNAKVDFENLD